MELSVELLGYLGTAFTVASYSMRTIVPLRIAGIGSSFAFIAYALTIQSWPILLTELIILPLNLFRLWQVLRLIRELEAIPGREFSVEWLESIASHRHFRRGDRVFAAGDRADYMLFVRSLVGELALFTAENRRTMSLECVEDGSVGVVSYADAKLLSFQHPKFGHYLLQLIASRLLSNLEHARAQAAARPEAKATTGELGGEPSPA
jgi:CRP/FNR family transcriptional regulator, cyclic AMP receptor protein